MRILIFFLLFMTFNACAQEYKTNKKKEFRVSIIFLDGANVTLNQINLFRNGILKDYEDGIPFNELAKSFSMDSSYEDGGDLGWFPQGRMYPEFENAVRNHKKGEIFTVDIPSKQWYYVVLKTHEDRWVKDGSKKE